MILRRMTQALRRQDWFTVFVELMIVVLGVFFGLQANNWNEARADRQREAGYLQGLAQDIRIDIADIDEIIRVSTLRMSAMSYLLEQADGAPLPDGFDQRAGASKSNRRRLMTPMIRTPSASRCSFSPRSRAIG